MFKPKESIQIEYEFVSINEWYLNDPLLRLIEKYIDFSFLLEKVRPFYSDDNGRPTDPLNLFKTLFSEGVIDSSYKLHIMEVRCS